MMPDDNNPIVQARALLQEAKKLGLSFSDCVAEFGVDRDSDPYAHAAHAAYHTDGEIEIDDTTVLSDSEKGNYVLAWCWIGKNEYPNGTDSDDEPCRFHNHYRCPNDGTTWDDWWSCACNDKCPECDAEIEPHESIEHDMNGNPMTEEARANHRPGWR